ncbi:hypothetical protein J31TS4_07820 [Paenibacillus sp. J31TS4]|uniref:polysaccharide deacetylase family protein n=1 Tax=Paenibacillus sp. J31TS4 TaxID=2807195 RepID=UPI001B1D8EED|nr:polysaccharide deacetylase family protein [Paenibacillus sp. J31TS4]GIP37502.1 hypothetical protein J31TS4_07820 [Paenibacillus sp. J31TS4]
MNRSLKPIAALAVMTALLAACQPGGAGTTAGPATTDATPSPPPAGASTSPSPSAAVSASPSPSTSANPGATAGAGEQQSVRPLYKMNNAYDLVPLEAETSKKVVLLTFDDGPKDTATLTPILDALDKHKAKAIFFVNGNRVKAHPELLKEIDRRGQTIGNHTWSHNDLAKQSNAEIDKELEDVQAIVKEVVGYAPVFLRPPFGSSNAYARQKAEELGLLRMNWSNGSLDWDASTKNKPQLVIQNVLDQLHPGSNILMHELPWTAEALDSLLTRLEEQGYGFVDPASIQHP